MHIVASTVCGFIFGLGLLISGMVQPAKVIGFLDIFGAWDPSLAVVMIAALVGFPRGLYVCDLAPASHSASQSSWPTKTEIDRPLVIGATLFGVGWGLVGCALDQRWRILRRSRRV